MRLAIVGKGGVGKTTIAGTLARLIARRGRRVLALDLDPNPGLTWTLGMAPTDAGLPELIARHRGGGAPPNAWELVPGTSADEAVERFATIGADGVYYLTPGKIFGPRAVEDPSMFGVRELVHGLDPSAWHVVADIDAATAVSCGRHVVFAERLLLVATPQRASALTVERLRDLLFPTPMDVLASMCGDEPDHPGLDPIAHIPFDPDVKDADRRGVSLLDNYPASIAVAALEELAERLLSEDATAPGA